MALLFHEYILNQGYLIFFICISFINKVDKKARIDYNTFNYIKVFENFMNKLKKDIKSLVLEIDKNELSDFERLISLKKKIFKEVSKIFLESLKEKDLKSAKPYNFNNSRIFSRANIFNNLNIGFLLIRKSNKSPISLSDLALSLEFKNKLILLSPKKSKIEVISFSKNEINHKLYDQGCFRKILVDKDLKLKTLEVYHHHKEKKMIISNKNDFINVDYYKSNQKIGYGIADIKQSKNVFYGIEYEDLKLFYDNKIVTGIKNKTNNSLNIKTSRINDFIKMLHSVLEKEYKYGDKISTKSIITSEETLLELIMLTETKFSI